MADFTLQKIMRVLEEGWGEYIKQFNQLSPDARAEFLQKEGFASFHNLLAHVIGWWEEGLWIITGIIEDPSFTWKERETDAFNLELIERFRSWSEEDLLLHYENVREALLDLVAELPEDALMNDDIREWLEADVIEHLEDHKIV